LYAAVAGLESVEDIPDAIANDREKMLEGIAQIDAANQRSEKMDAYVDRVEALYNKNEAGEKQAQEIAGILSDDGLGMSKEFAQSLLTDSDGDGQTDDINKDKMLEQAKALGFETVAEWAEALNKTEEDLYTEAAKNAKMSIKANDDAFKHLRTVLKSTKVDLTKFGQDAKISVENSAGLAGKLVEVY
jgi:hypothetical protein